MGPRQRMKALKIREMNREASDFTSGKLQQSFASRLSQQSPFAKTIQPQRQSAVTVNVPNGQPLVPINVANGLAIEDTVTIIIDTTALGLTLTQQKIVLFDQGGYLAALTPFTNPANSVIIGTAAANRYVPYICGTSARSYHYDGILITVDPAAGAAATADLQLQNQIITHRINTERADSNLLKVPNFIDGYQQINNVRVVPLQGDKGRVDRETAWEYDVYHGLRVSLTLYQFAQARD